MVKKQKDATINKKTSIGGQALIEGVMMRGPQKTAMAVRHTSGEIVKEIWDTNAHTIPKFWKLPLVRGIYNMVISLKVGYKCLMRSAELSGLETQEPNKPAKKSEQILMTVLMAISTVLGVLLALGLFMYLPAQLYRWIAAGIDAANGTQWATNAALRGVFEGVLRLLLFLVYLVLVSLMKDIRRVFMYHGAEHKTIFCYENGEELTVENVQKQSRFHPRCGTSFMALVLLIGMVISMCIQIDTVWLRVLVKIALLPLTAGIGYECIKLAGRVDNWFTRILSAPGLWIQRLTTREPDEDMIECAIEAFAAVVPEDAESDKW